MESTTKEPNVSRGATTGRVGGKPSARPGRRRISGDTVAAVTMIAPNAAMYLVFVIVPALAGVALSFFQWDLLDTPVWVGLDNYNTVFHDSAAWEATLNTGKFLALGVIPTVLVGFLFANLINSRMRAVGVVRVLYFVPLVVSTSVASVLWSWLYQPQSGLFNYVLKKFGINGPAWLADTRSALPALTLMLIWMSLPLVIILYLAALQRVPDDIHEAARMDGAGLWTRLWRISWPNVGNMTLLVAALEVLHFLAAPFEVALIMTQGGPINSTTTLSLYIYHVAFEQGNVGVGSALSLVQFLLVLVFAGGLRLVYRVRVGRS